MMQRLFQRFPNPAGYLLLLAGYFLLQWLLRVGTAGGFEMDEAEQLILGQRLQVGYSPDPPLYTWLQIPLLRLFGDGVVALSLLKNLLLFATYASSYFVARHAGLGRDQSALAALSLILLPGIGWESQRDLTHSVLVTTLAAVSLWVAMALLDGRRGWGQYLLLGLALGFGIISKWNYWLFAGALLVSLGSLQPRLLLNRRFALSLLLAAAIAAPFLLWMSGNLAVATATSYKLEVTEAGYLSHLGKGLYSLGKSYLEFGALFVLIFLLLFQPWHRPTTKLPGGKRPPGLRLLLRLFWAVLGLLLLFLLVSGGTVFRSRWMLPMLCYLPIMLFALASPGIWQPRTVQRYQWLLLLVMLLIPVGLAGRVYLAPLTGRYTKPHFPAVELAVELRKAAGPVRLVVAQDTFIGGNLKPNLPGSLVAAPAVDFPLLSIQGDDATPVLLVWNADEYVTLPPSLQSYLTQRLTSDLKPLGSPSVIERNYRLSKDRSYRLGWQLMSR